jgi:hypothetical protein
MYVYMGMQDSADAEGCARQTGRGVEPQWIFAG